MSDLNLDRVERRQDKMEDVVDRLTNISSDLSKMIAVHEQRLNHQEKQINNVETSAEKRREELEIRFEAINDKLEFLKQQNVSQMEKLTEKINDMEKIMWKYGGGLAVIAFVLAYGPSILRILNLH